MIFIFYFNDFNDFVVSTYYTEMMLDFNDKQAIARNIRKAVAEIVVEGQIQTYDMAKMSGQSDVIDKGAASTVQMADAIIEYL